MVEALVAISIILTGILATYVLSARAIGLGGVVADRYVATYLAAEGVEVVKNIIDANVLNGRPWNSDLSDWDRYELVYDTQNNVFTLFKVITGQVGNLNYDPATGFYTTNAVGNPTNFQRIIGIQNLGGGNELRVNSQVNWRTRGDAEFSVDLENHFFNWK